MAGWTRRRCWRAKEGGQVGELTSQARTQAAFGRIATQFHLAAPAAFSTSHTDETITSSKLSLHTMTISRRPDASGGYCS